MLIKGDCAYCHRSPTTWFGIDRIVPSLGYVIGNVVSCCYDCNLDKLDTDVATTMKRNGRIADRVDAGELAIEECEKITLRKSECKTSKRVCAYGNVYTSHKEASRALGKNPSYVGDCIRHKRHSEHIFEINILVDELFNI